MKLGPRCLTFEACLSRVLNYDNVCSTTLTPLLGPREHKGRMPRHAALGLGNVLGSCPALRSGGQLGHSEAWELPETLLDPRELSLGRGMQLSAEGRHRGERRGHWKGRTLDGEGGAWTAGPGRAAQGEMSLGADGAPVGASRDPGAWKGDVSPGPTGPTGCVHPEQEGRKG